MPFSISWPGSLLHTLQKILSSHSSLLFIMRKSLRHPPLQSIMQLSRTPWSIASSPLVICLMNLIRKQFFHQCPTPNPFCPFWSLQKVTDHLSSLTASALAEWKFEKILFLVTLASRFWASQLYSLTFHTAWMVFSPHGSEVFLVLL